jgi:hypothetical protein
MRRIVLTCLIVITAGLVLNARKPLATGSTFSALGDYMIEVAENPLLLDGKELETFVISYANTDMKVTVAINQTRNCRKYYVLSDNLSVQYVCNSRYFGVERLDKDLKDKGFNTSNDALNHEEYYRQRLITDASGSSMDYTKLAAAYFPFLIQNPEGLLAGR